MWLEYRRRKPCVQGSDQGGQSDRAGRDISAGFSGDVQVAAIISCGWALECLVTGCDRSALEGGLPTDTDIRSSHSDSIGVACTAPIPYSKVLTK